MPRARTLLSLLACQVVLLLAAPAVSLAGHVSAAPTVSARLAERISSRTWAVAVDWAINCQGAAAPAWGGNLNLIDLDTEERIYMGGISAASGSDRALVGRRSAPRRMQPELQGFCFDGPPLPHGSDTLTVRGGVVIVPALGDDNGDGVRDGGTNTPGVSDDPLRGGGCANGLLGTAARDTLDGTGAGDLIFGLGGADLLRGRAGHDCLIGGTGDDRLHGEGGWDRLTGGPGADVLVGGGGTNAFDAGSGRDQVNAVNGRREDVRCGSGRDQARVDRRDSVSGCELVTRVR